MGEDDRVHVFPKSKSELNSKIGVWTRLLHCHSPAHQPQHKERGGLPSKCSILTLKDPSFRDFINRISTCVNKGDSGRKSHGLETGRKKVWALWILYKHTVSIPTGQAVKQEKQTGSESSQRVFRKWRTSLSPAEKKNNLEGP